MTVFRLVAALFVSISAATLFAQSPTTASDAQSAYEPRSAPGAGQEFLKRLVGQWDVVKTFFPSSGKPEVVSGTCKQTMINGDRFLESDFIFGTGDNQTTGLGIIGFDPETGRFTSIWIDSRSTRVSFRQSEDKFNGQEIFLFSKSLNNATTRPSRGSRTATVLEDNDNRLVHRQYVRLPNGAERLVMELDMTRRSPTTMP